MLKKTQKALLSLLILFTMIHPIRAEGHHIIPLDQLDIGSEVYLLYDRDSKQVLAEKDSSIPVHPASITKVLTVITAIELMEPLNLKQEIAIAPEVYQEIDPEASIVGFRINERVTLEDILQGIMLPSGADATRALSFHLFQNTEKLAEAMNTKAKEIGMHNSNFVNTSGLDDDSHLSTAYDLALLVDYALENETFRKLYKSETYTSTKTEQHPEGVEMSDGNLKYANTLENNYIIGAKSGYTDGAQRALSSLGSDGNKELIFISLLNDDIARRTGPVDDANLVYTRAFEDFKEVTALNKNTVFDLLQVENALDYEYFLEEDIRVWIPKDLAISDLKLEIKGKPEGLVAPVEADTLLGVLEVSYKDKVIYQGPLINSEVIPIKLSKVILDFLKTFFFITALALSFVSIFVLSVRSYKIKKHNRRQKNRTP